MKTSSAFKSLLLLALLLFGGCGKKSTLQILFSDYSQFRATLVETKKFDSLYLFLPKSKVTEIDSWVLEKRQSALEELRQKFLTQYPEGLQPIGLQTKETQATLELQLKANAEKNRRSSRLAVQFVKEGEAWKLDLGEFLPSPSAETEDFPDIQWVRKTARHGAYSLECPTQPEVMVADNTTKWKFPRFENCAFHHQESRGLKLDTREKQFNYLNKLSKRSNGNKILHSEFLLDAEKYGPKPGVEWQVQINDKAVAKNRVFLLSENDSLLISGLYIPGSPGEAIVNRYLDSLEFAPQRK